MLRSTLLLCATAVGAIVLPSCTSGAELGRLSLENDNLKREVTSQARDIAKRDATLATLRAQINNLNKWGQDRPADLFAPTKIEIASLSGGHNYDERPGDDGITIYLSPKDADGDIVKVPGRIEVQLLNNTDLKNPKIIATFIFEAEKLRESWHGRFLTNHYTLKCPFPPKQDLPDTRRLLATVKFTDFLTGAELTATKELAFEQLAPRDK